MSANLTSPDSSPTLISPTISRAQTVDSFPTTSPVKLGVMASGSGSNFEAIASAIANGQLNAQISVLIYNNPGIKALARADKYGIPAALHNHRHTKKREDFDQQIVQTLRQYEVEWVVMAGWMRVVTQVLLDAFPNRILNIHPSLLPSFKGVRAVEQALEAGVKITGCTVHVVSLDIDSGPILFQAAVPVLPDDTPETLHARIQVQEHRILVDAIALINC
ncbi:MAG: phosphoribosylglycinamide formyltransferase [Moorea sp. SIO4A3]|nr:phosphoribosylglycinamide formyltransferase [Moorena sp. SIO4A3]